MNSSDSEEEKVERQERAERDARWAPTHSRWDLLPAMRHGPKVVSPRVEILEVYTEEEFRRIFR